MGLCCHLDRMNIGSRNALNEPAPDTGKHNMKIENQDPLLNKLEADRQQTFLGVSLGFALKMPQD